MNNVIIGAIGPEVWLVSALKAVGLKGGTDLVRIKPAVVSCELSAAPEKGKRKHAEMKLKLGFSPEMLKNPRSISFMSFEDSILNIYLSVDKKFLSEKGLAMAEESTKNVDATFDAYPELKALFDDFLPKWEAAYQRALASGEESETVSTPASN